MGLEAMTNVVNNKRVFLILPHLPVGFVNIVGRRDDIRLDTLEHESPSDVAAPVLSAAHAYQTSSTRQELARHYHTSADFLKKTPNLLLVSTNGAGYDTVDLKACTERGILVVNQSGGNAESVAEHVVGMMLMLVKRAVECDRALRAGTLTNRALYTGHEAFGKTIGIIGIGNVGRRVAELCGALFHMEVLAYDPYVGADEVRARGAQKVELDDLLRRSDFVSINCPLIDETRKMISAREYALMKPSAYFITTARGFIHDEDALARALRDKKLAGAGLDVWEQEPPPADHPLLAFDNVIVTAHTAGVTKEARIRMGQFAAEQMIAALDGKPVKRVLNPEVWPDYAKRFERTFGFAPQK
jgi:D-3-phosphoglycerate dehydrogenase